MPELGDTLGRYTLLKKLATGGMGEIYLAARMGPLGFASPVALKVLRDELATDSTFIEMLVDEAKISMFLNHQNVVSCLDFGEERGCYYIAMEFVQGVTLKNILDTLKAQRRKLDLSTGVYIANELCRALKYAHTRTNHAGEPLNIIHRDVTPANLLISIQGEVKLTDFGIARAKNRVHHTQAGVLKGKFGYMAPEMLRYEQIDARSDLFCAGVILYELACGQHPVEGATIMEAITRLEEKDIRPPSTFNKAVPRELDAVIMKALEPKPAQRWSTAHELSQALQELGFIDASRRIDIRHGSEQVVNLLREQFPQAFEPALPREYADRMFVVARQRSSLSPEADEGADAQPTSESDVRAERERLNASKPRGRHQPLDPADPATLIPRNGRASTSEVETDEHSRERMAAAAADATVNFAAISKASTAGGHSALEAPTGEIVIRFPDSSTDPSKARAALFEEPARPGRDDTSPNMGPTRAAIERAHADEATYMASSARANDDKTVSGMAVPEWDSMLPGRAPTVQVMEPPTREVQESIRDFAEDELPVPTSESSPAYDDGATAFGGMAPVESYSDDRTAFGITTLGAGNKHDDRTAIPDSELSGHPAGEKFTDDTLLDGLSRDDIDRAKAELAAAKKQIFESQDDEVGDTALRTDGLIDEAVAAASRLTPAEPRRALGRSASEASGERPNPAVALPPTTRPPVGRLQKPAGGPAGRAPAAELGPRGAVVTGVQGSDIGNDTGRWMRGELPAQDLSWGDDAAARRAVATRNAGPSQPPADPRRSAARPVPGAPGQPGMMQPGMMQPGMMQPGMMQPGMMQPGMMHPAMSGGMMPFPPQAPPANRSATFAVALATAVVALAAVIAVVARTRVAWPELIIESEPPGATVWIDEREMSERTPASFAVRPNFAHQVEVRLDGYVARRLPPVELWYVKKQPFLVQLERVRPKIRITPVAGRVTLNKRDVGRGSEVVLPLDGLGPNDPVELVIEADGYVSWARTFARLSEVPPSLDVPLSAQPPPSPSPGKR